MTLIRNIYTSVACNRTPGCTDWGRNGYVIYGASNAVALWDPQHDGNSSKILQTYLGHNKRVNCVRWLKEAGKGEETMFISGSDDGLAILWSIRDQDNAKKFLLHDHESGIYAVDGVQQPNGEWLLATSSADSSIKLWNFNGLDVTLLQTIHLKGGFCFALKLTLMPKSNAVLLAFSGDDETVSLWSSQEQVADISTDIKFNQIHKLTGHEDWVRSLDFIEENNDLLLASSSQDHFIRLWRISPRNEEQVRNNTVDIFNLLDNIRVEETIVQVASNAWFAISLDSVLFGHEGWVYGVHWHKTENGELNLLSSSIDKSLIIWSPSEDGVWMEKIRVGDVGGSSLGFFGGKFSPDGQAIMGHSYQGGFHIWQQSKEDTGNWFPQIVVGGHFGEVRDLCWEKEGAYLMTTSNDQTTRIHAPWLRKGKNLITWHEIARPQVHGYDMQSLAILSRYTFASGAEEKIVRIFQTSGNFIENFRRLCNIEKDQEGDNLLESLPKGAAVPSLGLSNKAVFKIDETLPEERHVKDEYPENYFIPVELNAPPEEETLMQNTLWPEIQKLYGHGYEIYALASSTDGKLLASSCKASNAEHAQVILWDTSTWKIKQKLPSHQLTVTKIRFSPNGQYILTVSRDRRWSLFEKQTDPTNNELISYSFLTTTDKTNGIHSRIIWSCDWSHDGKYFATSSRDGKIVIWSHQADENSDTNKLKGWKAIEVLEIKNESHTAVAFAPSYLNAESYLLAIGCDSGLISIYQFDGEFSFIYSLNKSQGHHLPVRQLQFRPKIRDERANYFQLASCGDDHLVRIYELNL